MSLCYDMKVKLEKGYFMRKRILQLLVIISVILLGNIVLTNFSHLSVLTAFADTSSPVVVSNEEQLIAAIDDSSVQNIEISGTYQIGGRGSGIQLTKDFDGKGKTIKVAPNNYGLLVDDSYANNSYGAISPNKITISNVNLVSEGGTTALPVLNVISTDDLTLSNVTLDMSAAQNLQATMNLKAVSDIDLSGITAAGSGAFIDYSPKTANTMNLSFDDSMKVTTGAALVMDESKGATLSFATNPMDTFFTALPSYDTAGAIDIAEKVISGEIPAPLNAIITYSTTTQTEKAVIVTLRANKAITIKSRATGWTATDSSNKVFTKVFTSNASETVNFIDDEGDNATAKVLVNWIVAPTPSSPKPTPPSSTTTPSKPAPSSTETVISPIHSTNNEQKSKEKAELPKTNDTSGRTLSFVGISLLATLTAFEFYRKIIKN